MARLRQFDGEQFDVQEGSPPDPEGNRFYFRMRVPTLLVAHYTVVSELIFAGVDQAIRHAITGHEGETVHEKVYAATIRRQAERLREYAEKIAYPSLELPKVYKAHR